MFDMNQGLMDELIQRELKQTKAIEEFIPKPPEPSTPPTPLSPKMAMLLGGAADAASTYGFLKQGGMREGNPMFQHFNKNPWTVLPTSAATGIGYHYLHKLLKSKAPKIANTAAGLLGGYQMALGGNNLERQNGNSYQGAMNDLQLKGNK